MQHETGLRLEVSFQSRQLLVADMVYTLNGLTAAFRKAISQVAEVRHLAITRDEYVLRLLKMRCEGYCSLELMVAATEKSMSLSDMESVAAIKSELCSELFELLVRGDSFGRVQSFQKAIGKKSPRLSDVTLRLIEKQANGEDLVKGEIKLT